MILPGCSGCDDEKRSNARVDSPDFVGCLQYDPQIHGPLEEDCDTIFDDDCDGLINEGCPGVEEPQVGGEGEGEEPEPILYDDCRDGNPPCEDLNYCVEVPQTSGLYSCQPCIPFLLGPERGRINTGCSPEAPYCLGTSRWEDNQARAGYDCFECFPKSCPEGQVCKKGACLGEEILGEPEPDPLPAGEGEGEGEGEEPLPDRFIDVVVATQHACALRESGRAQCWGVDIHGETLVPQDELFSDLAVQGNNSCGIREEDGSIVCWGIWDFINRNGVVIRELPDGEGFVDIDAPDTMLTVLCAKDELSSLACWYWGDPGWWMFEPEGRWNSFSTQLHSTCGVLDDGSAECFTVWGGFAPDSGLAVEAQAPDHLYVDVSSNNKLACGIRQDDLLVDCWGTPQLQLPAEVQDTEYRQIEGGGRGFCAVTVNGDVDCWLGIPVRHPQAYEYRRLSDGFIQMIDLSQNYACGIHQDDGRITCWDLLAPIADNLGLLDVPEL